MAQFDWLILTDGLAQATPTIKHSIAQVRKNIFKGTSQLTHYFTARPKREKNHRLAQTPELVDYRQGSISMFFNCNIQRTPVASTQ